MAESKRSYLCEGCQRPLGRELWHCPYCGAPAAETLRWRRGRLWLPLLASAAVAAALLLLCRRGICHTSGRPWPRAGSLLLALATAVAWLPLAGGAALPGGAGRLLRRQLLLGLALRCWYGVVIVATGVLATMPQVAWLAGVAAVALAGCPRALRLPAWPLLGGLLAAAARWVALQGAA